MKVNEVYAKNILSRSKVLDYTINPYVGCEHGCTYCYARFMKRFTGHKEEWGQFVDVKINATRLLKRETEKKQPGRVWISGVCDPYQPIEGKYKLTRKNLKILVNYKNPVSILTKSDMILNDLDLLKQFKEVDVNFTITTLNEKWKKFIEPNSSTTKQRLQAMKKIVGEGITTSAMMGPYWPIFSDPDALFRVRIKSKEHTSETKQIIKNFLSSNKELIRKLEFNENYKGEHGAYKRGWNIAQKFFEISCRFAISRIDDSFERGEEYDDEKLIHCFCNQVHISYPKEIEFYLKRLQHLGIKIKRK